MKRLTVLLIGMKLMGVIQWPWLWVLGPLWVPVLLFAAAFACILIGGRIKKGAW